MAQQPVPNGQRQGPVLHRDHCLATFQQRREQLLPMKELASAINHPLAAEFQTSHSDLAMSIGLREKSHEERSHAARMIASLVDQRRAG